MVSELKGAEHEEQGMRGKRYASVWLTDYLLKTLPWRKS